MVTSPFPRKNAKRPWHEMPLISFYPWKGKFYPRKFFSLMAFSSNGGNFYLPAPLLLMSGISYHGHFAFLGGKRWCDDLFWSRVAISPEIKTSERQCLIVIFSNQEGWSKFWGMLLGQATKIQTPLKPPTQPPYLPLRHPSKLRPPFLITKNHD